MKIGTWAQAGVAAIAGASGIAVAHTTSPFATAYAWAAGFGAKFTNPATLPTGTGNAINFTPGSLDAIIAHDSTPFASAYPWTASGFGTKFANPSTAIPANANDCKSVITPAAVPSTSRHTVALATDGTGTVLEVYIFGSSGWGSAYTRPGASGTGTGTDWASDASAVLLSATANPYINGWPWSALSGAGTKFANPATLPANQGQKIDVAPNDAAVAIAHAGTPFMTVYAFDPTTGFGTKYADPTLPAYALGQGRSIKFSPAQDAIVLGHQFGTGGECATAWEWSDGGGFGAILGGPLPTIGGSGNGIVFENSGGNVALAIGPSPRIIAHPWALGFGVRYAAPGTLPTGTGNGVDFAYA